MQKRKKSIKIDATVASREKTLSGKGLGDLPRLGLGLFGLSPATLELFDLARLAVSSGIGGGWETFSCDSSNRFFISGVTASGADPLLFLVVMGEPLSSRIMEKSCKRSSSGAASLGTTKNPDSVSTSPSPRNPSTETNSEPLGLSVIRLDVIFP